MAGETRQLDKYINRIILLVLLSIFLKPVMTGLRGFITSAVDQKKITFVGNL